MSLEKLNDESVERYYESIRKQVDADRAYKYPLTASPSVRERAETLRQEMIRRKLQQARKQASDYSISYMSYLKSGENWPRSVWVRTVSTQLIGDSASIKHFPAAACFAVRDRCRGLVTRPPDRSGCPPGRCP